MCCTHQRHLGRAAPATIIEEGSENWKYLGTPMLDEVESIIAAHPPLLHLYHLHQKQIIAPLRQPIILTITTMKI